MGSTTSIQWTDATWNPVTGCTKVSAGCKNCWAESQAKRFWHRQYPMIETKEGSFVDGLRSREFSAVQCHPERLDIPLRWRRPRKIAVALMGDLFHDRIPNEFINRVFAVMALCPQHSFQLLSKRPARILKYMSVDSESATRKACVAAAIDHLYDSGVTNKWRGYFAWPPPNIWLGVSVENQETADERIPLLLQTPAAVRWVSLEPLLAPIRLDVQHGQGIGDLLLDGINWIVVGGESGREARPCRVSWVRSVVDQSRAGRVPVFVKQLGRLPVIPEAGSEPPSTGVEHQWAVDREWPIGTHFGNPTIDVSLNGRIALLHDPKGANPDEWPSDLRVRGWPRQPG